jgi:transposase InsO family protein
LLKLPSLKIKSVNGLFVDTSTGHARILVPTQLQEQVVASLHGITHPGIRGTALLCRRYYVWGRMQQCIKQVVNNCINCGRGKVTRQLSPPSTTFTQEPFRRFHTVHCDIVGPLPSQNQRYLLTCVDRSTRWCEAVPISSTSAEEVARMFVTTWISRFGVPAVIVTDRGSNFTSAVWAGMCHRLGVQHRTTTAYHPQANGICERWHRRLKDALRSAATTDTWQEDLPLILLGLRAQPRTEDDTSPAEAVYGSPLVLPGTFTDAADLSPAQLADLLKPSTCLPPRPVQPAPTIMAPGMKWAFVRVANPTPLQPRYQGPYKVLRQTRTTARLQLEPGREDTVHLSRIKPYLGQSTPVEAVPPRRGRPRRRAQLGAPVVDCVAPAHVDAVSNNSTPE